MSAIYSQIIQKNNTENNKINVEKILPFAESGCRTYENLCTIFAYFL